MPHRAGFVAAKALLAAAVAAMSLAPLALCAAPAAKSEQGKPEQGKSEQRKPAQHEQKEAAPASIPPSQLAAARALVLSSGISRSFGAVIPEFMDQITGSLTQTRPEIAPDLNDVMNALRPEFEKQADEMIDIAAQIFASRMSEADLKATVAFFNSPAGKQYVAVQPAVLADVVTAMQGWQGKISTNMMARVREEMKKKGHDI